MEAPSWSLAGQLGLPELAALLWQARLLVANNTGPVHVAAVVGTPVVDLYALTNPQHPLDGAGSGALQSFLDLFSKTRLHVEFWRKELPLEGCISETNSSRKGTAVRL